MSISHRSLDRGVGLSLKIVEKNIGRVIIILKGLNNNYKF